MKAKHSKEKRNNNKLILIFRIISIIIIICCLTYIYFWYLDNKNNAKMLEKINTASIIDTSTLEIPIINENTETENNTATITTYTLNFEELMLLNKSTVGWISVPNTSINYPVVKHSDNSFYLNHSFDKSYNKAGWIFADYRNKFDGSDKNIIIYGHNRMDNSMFATLSNTQKKNWYTNPNNKYITFNTPDGNICVYEIFSAYTIKSETYYLSTTFQNDDIYLDFLNTLKNRSIYNFGVNLNSNDKILTLSTCDSSGKSRIIVHAKKII